MVMKTGQRERGRRAPARQASQIGRVPDGPLLAARPARTQRWLAFVAVPKATWWNLSEDKRARVTDAAMREFGSRGFSSGSLNVIASEADIAKGSLFQYFEDKTDLFVTICEHVSSEVEGAVLSGVDPDGPLFENLRRLVQRWMAYFRAHPLERKIADATLHERDGDVRSVVRAVPNAHHDAGLRPLVRAAVARGELRPDVDERMVISLITVVLRHLNSAPFEPAGDVAIPFRELSDGEVDGFALAYIDALESAFGA
jgi:AcrR family transcriptional regulator